MPGVGLRAIAHPFDQQAQAVRVMVSVMQRFGQTMALPGQALVDARTERWQEPVALSGTPQRRSGRQNGLQLL